MKIGRNNPCPCGSGKKYKKCCGFYSTAEVPSPPSGKFRFEPGSYGGPGVSYVPSLLCQKQISETDWRDHFVLVNPQKPCADEAAAVAIAKADLAMSLKSKGYMNVEGFRVIKEEGDAE